MIFNNIYHLIKNPTKLKPLKLRLYLI